MATISDVQIHSIPIKLAGTMYYLPFATIPTEDSYTDVTSIIDTVTGFEDALSVYRYLQSRYPQLGDMYIPPYAGGGHNVPARSIPVLSNVRIENTATGVWHSTDTIIVSDGEVNTFRPVDNSAWLDADNTDNYVQVSVPILNEAVIVNNSIVGANLSNYTYVLRFRWTRQPDTTYTLTITGYATPTIAGSRSSRVSFLDTLANIPIDSGPIPGTDPYTGAGYPASTAPGGYSGGSFDFTDNGLTGVHTPGLDLLGSGLITVWRPTKAILSQLASWLWVTTPGQVIQQLFGNPINAIIGLNIVPVSPPVDSGANTIKFGLESSGVLCPKVTSQHVSVDCGSLTVAPIYGSYMDYAPNTSAELYLPYVGGLPIDVNDVIGKTLSITYQVDVVSGACVAYVHVDGKLHYQRSGSCAATAPITGSQMPNVVSGVLSIAGSVAGFFASAGGSGAGTAAQVASGISTATSVAASTANALKQSISYTGTVAGWAGLLGAQKPYLVLSVPNAAIPAGQADLMGYPAWVGGRLGDFHGRTSCTATHITIPTATDEEIAEIKEMLEMGVFLP